MPEMGKALELKGEIMNNIDEMWSICHDCPYWEICEPPYICEITEEKMKDKNSECRKTVFKCNMCPFRNECKQRKEV